MTSPVIGNKPSTVSVQQRRIRQTPKPVSTFNEVLRGSAQVLLAGAEVASSVVGSSVLSAAVSRTRQKLATHSGSTPSTESAGGPLGQGQDGADATGQTGTDYDAMRKLQQQGREMNMFFLELQQKMAQENRKFTTLSNVLKSKHDTARSAINNIRS
jgi:hypothetical protein